MNSDPNIQDRFGMTPLHLAVIQEYAVIVKLLVKHGARIDIQDEE